MLNGIDIHFIDKIKQLNVNQYDNSLGFSYCVGWIFTKKHIEMFTHGIWNIHPGKLPDNRGCHPITWSFLNNDKKFYVSIHSINEAIDQGNLLAMDAIQRDINDTQKEVINKLEDLLISKVIDNAFQNYSESKIITLTEGNYYPRISNQFHVLDPSMYDSKTIFNIFKNQYVYGGVIIYGKRYMTCDFFHPNFIDISQGQVFQCNDGIKIIAH
jgi:methionyl-tRNA formyltransferase